MERLLIFRERLGLFGLRDFRERRGLLDDRLGLLDDRLGLPDKRFGLLDEGFGLRDERLRLRFGLVDKRLGLLDVRFGLLDERLGLFEYRLGLVDDLRDRFDFFGLRDLRERRGLGLLELREFLGLLFLSFTMAFLVSCSAVLTGIVRTLTSWISKTSTQSAIMKRECEAKATGVWIGMLWNGSVGVGCSNTRP